MELWFVITEFGSLLFMTVLFFEGSLFKRDLSQFSNLIRYCVLKICILIACFLPLCYICPYIIPFVIHYAVTFLRNPELHSGRPSRTFFTFPWWKTLAKKINSQVVRTCILPKSKYIFAAHPHGVLPFGICLNIGTNAGDIDTLFPQIRFRGVAVSCCYIIPFYRDFCLAMGGTDCRASTIRNVLREGCSPVVVPGGADESLLTVSYHNHVLMKHKGFIRIAIQEGVDIVPMYSFGENNIWYIPEGKKPIGWLNVITKGLLGIRIPPVTHLLPRPTEIKTVFGSPISVNQCDYPTEEEVNRIFDEYVNQIQEIFSKYRPEGEGDLVIEK